MINFLMNYGLFLAKAITIVLAVIIIFSAIVAIASKGKASKDKLKIRKLNDRYEEYQQMLSDEILPKEEVKQLAKSKKKEAKVNKQKKIKRKRLFVVNFNGDIKAQATSSLREEVTAILLIAKNEDEVVVNLESPGGIVPSYGLAASQLKRIRDKDIPLTVVVDKVAASGGYMMACVANKIIAAPYAVIGSIGVVAQLPNFHRLLKRNDIDFEQITAGEYKRTLSLFAENTEKGKEKVQEDVDNVHRIFKRFIKENRPQVNIDEVATGEHWHGVQALELKLVDQLMTSDDYLLSKATDTDIYEIHYLPKKKLMDKFSLSVNKAYHSFMGLLT